MIEKTDAVVLRTMKFKESSRIVTFYTRRFGKLAGIAKGSRRRTSTVAAALQPMSHVAIVFYQKEGREIQTITQCDRLRQFRSIGEDLEKMAIGMKSIELLQIATHEGDPNPRLFDLLVETLSLIDGTAGRADIAFQRFEIKVATELGFALQFITCVSCRRDISAAGAGRFDLDRGGPVCPECTSPLGNTVEADPDILRELHRIAHTGGSPPIQVLRQGTRSTDEIQSLLWSYFRHHVPGMRDLRSEAVFSTILAES